MVPVVEIIRIDECQTIIDVTDGTFGVLRINKGVFCVTLEPRDELNAPFKSSIPAQQYMCERKLSPKFGETFCIRNVPGRDNVLFHAGNFVGDTEGCILLGEYFGKLRGNRAINNSGRTFGAFMAVMEGIERFHLTIHEFY